MTIFQTAYDTTACNGQMLEKTVEAIEKAITLTWVSRVSFQNLHPNNKEQIYLIENDQGQIPAFAHSLLVKNPLGGTKEKELAVDVRGFGRWDPIQNKYVVRNSIEYKIAIHRAALNGIWINESPTILRDISKLPLAIYSSWISEAIKRRYGLEPDQQMKLSILAAIFYLSLFTDRGTDEPMDEREKLRVTNAISQAVRVKAQDVLSVLDEVDVIPNVSAFCALAEKVTGSVRLKEFNVGMLYSIIGSSWYNNQKEIIATALEHPPTWLAILIASKTERIFKNSVIAQLMERLGRDSDNTFLRPVLSLLKVDD